MTVTRLDPGTALVVIDLQRGILGTPTVHPLGDVVARAASLAAAFRRHRLPVVLVSVDGAPPGRRTERARPRMALSAGWTDLLPELDRQPEDHAVTKRTPGAFTATGLEAHLRACGVTQVVIRRRGDERRRGGHRAPRLRPRL